MANKLTVQSLNDKFTAAILDASSFIKESKNYASSLFKKGARGGTTATLYFDGAGETAVTADAESGMSISSMSGDVKQYSVQLKVGNAKGKLSWNNIEEYFKMDSLDDDLVKPTANALAEKLVKEVIAQSALRSTGVIIGSASAPSFATLASAASSLRKVRAGMTLVGHVDSDTNGALAALPVVAGNNHFDAPSEKLASLYGDAIVGTFHKVAVLDEPFMPIITTGASCGNSCLVNGEVTQSAVTDGADTMNIKIDGIQTATSIKAGSVFSISGVNRCTASGTELVGSPYHFVVQEDATVTSGAATLKVLPVYFTGAGYIPTVSVNKIADNSAITWITGANKSYAVSIIRAREALNWTPIEMQDIRGCENGKTTVPTMSCHTAFDGDINDASNTGRLDVLFSGKIVDPRLVRTIYWELAA